MPTHYRDLTYAMRQLRKTPGYGVKTYDPTVIGLAVSMLAVCAILAGLIPARRATSIEPMQALRNE